MKVFLILAILIPSTSWACKVKLDVIKNQSDFNMSEFTQFQRGLKKRNYQVVDTGYQQTFALRIMKRYNDHNTSSLFALVSIDVYDDKNIHTLYASRKGRLSQDERKAYGLSAFDAALASLLEEFPKCPN